MDWKLNGTCSIDVVDGYYDDATGGNDTGGGGNGDGEGGGNGNGNGGNGGNGIVPLFRYRSISLSKPFPKANVDFSNIAVNWIEWMNDASNRLRISNTYANGIKYSIIISKFGDKSGTVSERI